MAVNIVTQPKLYNAINECFKWSLQITDIGSGNIIKKIWYQLFDENNIAIHKEKQIFTENVAGTERPFDFSQDIAGLVQTMFVEPHLGIAVNDPDIIKGFYLKYGEAIYDTANCGVATYTTNTSAIKYLINANIQEYENDILNNNLPNILTHQPTYSDQCRGAANFTWVHTGGTATNITYTASDGQTKVINTGSNKITAIPMHPQGVFTFFQQIKWMTVQVGTPFQNPPIKIGLNDCCCDEDENYFNIMYLDPLGGRAVKSFECVESFELNTTHTEICRFRPCSPVASSNPYDVFDKNMIAGKGIFDKKVVDSIKLSASTSYNKEVSEQFKAFLSSSGYHIQYNENGVPKFRKFIVESGSVIYDSKLEVIELQVTGHFANAYDTHRFDR